MDMSPGNGEFMAKLGNIFDFDNDDDSSQQGGNRQNNNNGGNNNRHQKPPKQMIYYYLIAALIIIALNFFFLPSMANRSIVDATYNEFISQAEQGNIDQVVIDEEERTITFTLEGQNLTYRTGYISLDLDLVPMLKDSGADFVSEIPTSINPIWLIIYNLLPFILLIAFGSWLSKRMQQSMGSGGGMFGGLGKANAKVYEKDKTGVTFKDVAGEDEAKELLQDMVDFLHNPQKYKAIGATIPKGALLVGPPGTGKTLLAKAVAGEADVPFFSMSGSEFVELYVGMGAAKVRDLFKQAEQKAPCIIFIDEIDAIGKKRGNGAFGGNDERTTIRQNKKDQ